MEARPYFRTLFHDTACCISQTKVNETSYEKHDLSSHTFHFSPETNYIKYKSLIQKLLTYSETEKFIFHVHKRSAPNYISQLSSVTNSIYFKNITRYYAQVLSNFK
jgi:hypothetical protein